MINNWKSRGGEVSCFHTSSQSTRVLLIGADLSARSIARVVPIIRRIGLPCPCIVGAGQAPPWKVRANGNLPDQVSCSQPKLSIRRPESFGRLYEVRQGNQSEIVLAAHADESVPAFLSIRHKRHPSAAQLLAGGIILGTRHMNRSARSKG